MTYVLDDITPKGITQHEMETPNPEALLRPSEASAVLNICRSKVYELLKSGSIPSVRLGRSVRVPAKALYEWIRTNTRG